MMETGLDREALVELYQIFVEELLLEKEKLINFHSAKEMDRFGKTVHNIKGISGSYKADLVYTCASLMDAEIKKGVYDSIGSHLSLLLKEIESAVSDIRSNFPI